MDEMCETICSMARRQAALTRWAEVGRENGKKRRIETNVSLFPKSTHMHAHDQIHLIHHEYTHAHRYAPFHA